jgi:sugar phosphate permease
MDSCKAWAGLLTLQLCVTISLGLSIIIGNWFPKKGRGFLVGCWASCANVGDIIGTEIYSGIYDKTDNWGLPFIVCGGLVLSFGIISMLLLVEYPV